jgi:spermidine synthase
MGLGPSLRAETVYETTSAYHHIRVVDANGLRTLYFDDAPETRMSLRDPLKGHFAYTEYFHMPWLWNTQVRSVLMIGLGGGSVQQSFAHYYPNVKLETVEIDPAVVRVARDYFHFRESATQKVQVEDGRVYLRRRRAKYDLIIVDAYVQGRYGSSIPQHLATREFFELARDRLTTNGIVAYNVIGTTTGWHANIVGALWRTLKAVFPQVYLFPAKTSQNVVLIATRSTAKANFTTLRQRARLLEQTGNVTLPGFANRLWSFQALPPRSAARSPVLTDDYAPVEGLASGGGGR